MAAPRLVGELAQQIVVAQLHSETRAAARDKTHDRSYVAGGISFLEEGAKTSSAQQIEARPVRPPRDDATGDPDSEQGLVVRIENACVESQRNCSALQPGREGPDGKEATIGSILSPSAEAEAAPELDIGSLGERDARDSGQSRETDQDNATDIHCAYRSLTAVRIGCRGLLGVTPSPASALRPLPQAIGDLPRQPVAQLASHHHDLPPVVTFMRHVVGQEVRDVGRRESRQAAAVRQADLEQLTDCPGAPGQGRDELAPRHAASIHAPRHRKTVFLAQHLDPHAAAVVEVSTDHLHRSPWSAGNRRAPHLVGEVLDEERRHAAACLPRGEHSALLVDGHDGSSPATDDA